MSSKKSNHKCCHSDHLAKTLENFKATKSTKQQQPSNTNATSVQPLMRNIEKRILHGSTSQIPVDCEAAGGGLAYPKESKFIFHYQIRKLDEDRTILDDTRKYGKTMELYSGKEFQLDFWEHCLGTMLPGEVATFTVPPERLHSFAAVNKKLRDYMLGKQGAQAKHCCGMMGFHQQGGLGYPDLDELLLKPESLEFIFELLRVDIPDAVRKESWIMSAEEKAEIIPVLREEGNQLYSAGKFEEASIKYKEALSLAEQLTLREKPGDAEWTELDLTRVPLFVNLAQCQLRLKQYYPAIETTTEAISRDPSNVKAFFRRAKAYKETWDLDLAVQDFRKVAELMPEMSHTIANELDSIETKRREQELRERRMLSGKLLG